MKKNKPFLFCIFTILLLFTVVQPALAVTSSSKISYISPISLSVNKTDYKPLQNTLPKKVVTQQNQCPCIVFRLDDIQSFYLSDVQMKIMDLFQKKNASLSVGVIGYGLTEDTKLISYMKNNLKSGHAPLEIANHG